MTRSKHQQYCESHGRGSGILLHITSLPSPYGIGDFGSWAYRFADFLAQAGQKWWQILPLTATDYEHEYSPYNCMSAFAGNKYLISPDLMIQGGFLKRSDLSHAFRFPNRRILFPRVAAFKDHIFDKAYTRFQKTKRRSGFLKFCSANASWLDDYALFAVLKKNFRNSLWTEWPPPIAWRDPYVLRSLTRLFKVRIEREKFLQYVFAGQWQALKKYCNKKRIEMIGDIPIYVDRNSADVWTHPEMFKLDKEGRPTHVSGVPPDYFSRDGQLWGNPVYRWNKLAETGFRWWFQRIKHNLHLFDLVRMDHFRGFVAYWQVPARAKTAREGSWVRAPAAKFFDRLERTFKELPMIAEDLGTITPDVRAIIDHYGLPGMRVLLFAFGDGSPTNPYLPHNHIRNCVVYTGTHDNNTVRGWFAEEAQPREKRALSGYLGKNLNRKNITNELIRVAMMSVADKAIIPMQDILNLGSEARMNRPASVVGNWTWRLIPGHLTSSIADRLRALTVLSGRG